MPLDRKKRGLLCVEGLSGSKHGKWRSTSYILGYLQSADGKDPAGDACLSHLQHLRLPCCYYYFQFGKKTSQRLGSFLRSTDVPNGRGKRRHQGDVPPVSTRWSDFRLHHLNNFVQRGDFTNMPFKALSCYILIHLSLSGLFFCKPSVAFRLTYSLLYP